MSTKTKSSAAAVISLFAVTALATTGAEARPRHLPPCDVLSWWACGGVSEAQAALVRGGRDDTQPRTYMDYTDPRYNSSMRDGGGGGGGGGGR